MNDDRFNGLAIQNFENEGGRCLPEVPEEVVSSLDSKEQNPPPVDDKAVYQALAAHQQAQADWHYRDILLELQRWHGIFQCELRLELPPVALCIGPTRSNCYGYFRPFHNDFGFRREIKINRDPLLARMAKGEFWAVLGTLLHELLHAWQAFQGKPGSGNYHNVQFQTKASEYGLLVDARGYTEYAPVSLFMDLLKKHGVHVPELLTPILRERGESKQKKWSCACTNVRVAVAHFRAVCLNCSREFVRQD